MYTKTNQKDMRKYTSQKKGYKNPHAYRAQQRARKLSFCVEEQTHNGFVQRTSYLSETEARIAKMLFSIGYPRQSYRLRRRGVKGGTASTEELASLVQQFGKGATYA